MKTIFDILRGVVIGLANIIPGVSGGTMMVSMGIYDTIIGCINSLFKDFKRCVKMLWPYALGMVLGSCYHVNHRKGGTSCRFVR